MNGFIGLVSLMGGAMIIIFLLGRHDKKEERELYLKYLRAVNKNKLYKRLYRDCEPRGINDQKLLAGWLHKANEAAIEANELVDRIRDF